MGDSNVNVYELENTDDGEFYQAVRHAIVSIPNLIITTRISLPQKDFKIYHINN